ncbi:MAG: copper homeostasis protein CutC [Marinilabiliales bacterium]|nr:copper homeostasis protein CutC [Marinilabiliales bacterium]
MEIIREVCVESFAEAARAVKAGATRIELCDNLTAGGTTPSMGTIHLSLEHLPVPVMVMIRPRGGDFVYSDLELEIMASDILQCKELGVKGIVLGVLHPDHGIDVERTRQLVELAHPMEVTFHKAFDLTPNLPEALLQLKSTGIQRILTSGGKATAMEAIALLTRLIELAGPELQIIVAGKVTTKNIETLQNLLPTSEFHGRKLVDFVPDWEI